MWCHLNYSSEWNRSRFFYFFFPNATFLRIRKAVNVVTTAMGSTVYDVYANIVILYT